MSVVHRVPLPAGATAMVEPGVQVEPDAVLATRRPPGAGINVPVAARLRRAPERAAECLVARPGSLLDAGAVLARDDHGREVRVPSACLFLGYDSRDGTALVAPLGGSEPIVGHVRGEVSAVDPEGIEIRIAGAAVTGVGGSGGAVHGELRVVVPDPAGELRASAIDVAATGRIIVGGSRASAEALTRARAMGVAGIVLGGVLDKELRDFEATQLRRRRTGAATGELGILLLEGFGKVGLDPGLFAWFRSNDGHLASLFGAAGRLYVYDADAPPARRVLPRPGDRVVAHRRPHAGQTGELVEVLGGLRASPAGIASPSGIVRFADGLSAVVPLANLEATERFEPTPGD
jgi:hypothetical protein